MRRGGMCCMGVLRVMITVFVGLNEDKWDKGEPTK